MLNIYQKISQDFLNLKKQEIESLILEKDKSYDGNLFIWLIKNNDKINLDFNEIIFSLNTKEKDQDNNTALHWAFKLHKNQKLNFSYETWDYLIKGSDLSVANNFGFNALMYYFMYKEPQNLQLNFKSLNKLIKNTDLSQSNKYGNSLHYMLKNKIYFNSELRFHILKNSNLYQTDDKNNNFFALIKNVNLKEFFLNREQWNYVADNALSQEDKFWLLNNDKYISLSPEKSLSLVKELISSVNSGQFLFKIFEQNEQPIDFKVLKQVLLSSDLNTVNKNGQTPLMTFLLNNKNKKLYLDKDCWDILLLNTDLKKVDFNQKNALFYYAIANELQEIKFNEQQFNYLLQNSDINAKISLLNDGSGQINLMYFLLKNQWKFKLPYSNSAISHIASQINPIYKGSDAFSYIVENVSQYCTAHDMKTVLKKVLIFADNLNEYNFSQILKNLIKIKDIFEPYDFDYFFKKIVKKMPLLNEENLELILSFEKDSQKLSKIINDFTPEITQRFSNLINQGKYDKLTQMLEKIANNKDLTFVFKKDSFNPEKLFDYYVYLIDAKQAHLYCVLTPLLKKEIIKNKLIKKLLNNYMNDKDDRYIDLIKSIGEFLEKEDLKILNKSQMQEYLKIQQKSSFSIFLNTMFMREEKIAVKNVKIENKTKTAPAQNSHNDLSKYHLLKTQNPQYDNLFNKIDKVIDLSKAVEALGIEQVNTQEAIALIVKNIQTFVTLKEKDPSQLLSVINTIETAWQDCIEQHKEKLMIENKIFQKKLK